MVRPNIVLLYADQHRADVLGCAGDLVVRTPNLDRLAAEGVRFANAWTESPICQPARASLITGRYAHDHERLGNFVADFDPGWPTFMKALQAVGYRTASIGKTHYSSWPLEADFSVSTQAPPGEDWLRSFGWDHVAEEFDRYVHAEGVDTPYMVLLREHGLLEAYQAVVRSVDRLSGQHWRGVTSPLPQALDLTSFLADQAIGWLEEQDHAVPFFLQLSFVAPHVPLMGDPEWAAYYADAEIPRGSRQVPSSGSAAWGQHLQVLRHHSHSEMLSDEFLLAGARQYYAMVSLIDQRVGGVLATLEQRGLLENTWVVYSADHGEMLGEHELMAKMSFYAPSVRVPAIIRPPGGMPATVVEQPVQAMDVAATILAVAGTGMESDARSLLPLLDGRGDARLVFSEIQLAPGLPTWCAVTDGRWRLTLHAETGDVSELFDLATDPDEDVNLAGLAEHAETEARLADACTRFRSTKESLA